MLNSFILVLTNARLRVCTLGLFLSGITFSATMPYQSLIGIDNLKMSNDLYAMLVFAISIASMLIGVGMGWASDRYSNRYALIPPAALIGAFGFGLFFLYPRISTFVFVHLLPIPISGSLYSLFFAAARKETSELPTYQRDAVTSTIRAIFAISWVLVPTVMGFVLSFGWTTDIVYLIAACSCLINAGLFAFSGVGRNQAAPQQESHSRSAPQHKERLQDLVSGMLIWRLLLVGMIASSHKLQEILYALVITGHAGGKESDVGHYAGMVALGEIPLMLVWGYLLKWIHKSTALAIGAVFYATYLMLLSHANSMTAVYATVLLNALGASVILSVTISYLQGIFEDRPGLSTSLSYVTSLIGVGISSSVFSITATGVGYADAALIGAALILAGGLGLALTEAWASRSSKGSRAS